MKTLLVSAALALGLSLAAEPAMAKEIHADGLTFEEAASWLQDAGYQAKVKKTDEGERYLVSSAEGVNFELYLYDCKKERCASIQFSAGFDVDKGLTYESINAWNSGNRWTRGYIDKDMDPWLTFDVATSPGGTYEALDDNLGVWLMMLGHFKKHIDW